MLTGFNTDITHNGRVFHVQTEDKGKENPVIETLIYLGGEIIDARRTSYRSILQKRGFQPKLIYKLMERQHKLAIADIRAGRFDEPQPVETSPIDDMFDRTKTLDEVILEYLTAQTQQESIVLEYDRERFFFEGENIALPIRVLKETSKEPVEDAQIVVKILSTIRPALTVFEGSTDETGKVHAKFKIPLFPGGMAALVIQAFYGNQSTEEKVLIMRKVPGSRTARTHPH